MRNRGRRTSPSHWANLLGEDGVFAVSPNITTRKVKGKGIICSMLCCLVLGSQRLASGNDEYCKFTNNLLAVYYSVLLVCYSMLNSLLTLPAAGYVYLITVCISWRDKSYKRYDIAQ